MRALALAALVMLAGCAQILGIDDPRGDRCSPFDVHTCDLSDTCDLDEGTHLLTCRPEGGLAEYAPCGGDIGDTCSGALTCYEGVCRHFCDAQHGCGSNGESSCTNDLPDTTQKVCDDDCDVLQGTGCAGGLECVANRSAAGTLLALCIPPGYFGDVASGQHCDFFNACFVGLGCDDGPGGDSTCRPLCTVGGGDCAGTCVELGRLHETLDLGVCRS
jgi:hypothetical protein